MTTTSSRFDEEYESRDSRLDGYLRPSEIVMQTHMKVIAVIHLVMATGLVIAAIIVTLAVAGGGRMLPAAAHLARVFARSQALRPEDAPATR